MRARKNSKEYVRLKTRQKSNWLANFSTLRFAFFFLLFFLFDINWDEKQKPEEQK